MGCILTTSRLDQCFPYAKYLGMSKNRKFSQDAGKKRKSFGELKGEEAKSKKNTISKLTFRSPFFLSSNNSRGKKRFFFLLFLPPAAALSFSQTSNGVFFSLIVANRICLFYFSDYLLYFISRRKILLAPFLSIRKCEKVE